MKNEYWASIGCAVMQCSNTEVGAGTMNPLTFLRVLGPEPWNVAYVEPSIRPDDSRYGENPNRLQRHTQFQVILKPDPGNSQDLFIRSLSALVNANETLDGRKVQSADCFPYLRSIIQADGGLDGDVAHRIKSGWLKWKSATGFLCDPGIPNRLKGKFYRTAIRPALLYGTECWAVKQCHVHKMPVAEMRMLRWMCGHTRKDRVRNEIIRTKVGVTCIENKMRENRLKWFGHIKRREMSAPVRRLERWQEEETMKVMAPTPRINVNDHDIRFVEDNWESPVLGAWGLGWEIWMDGMEITQFTYFQQAGSVQLMPVSVEITYGIERILMLLQGVDHFKKIQYADGITYEELFLENEKEMSAYYLEHASVNHIHNQFDLFEAEARRLLDLGLAIPAYDQLLKASHAFNVLDSRGFVGVTERARYFGRMRSLARQCAQLWIKTRESLGHPLGVASYAAHSGFQKEDIEERNKKICAGPRTFLLEIGTEELPPNDVINACSQLKDLVKQLLEKQRLSHGNVQTYGTPRRIVVCVDNLCDKQVADQIVVRGPPASKAFDPHGNPTKAAEGFCRKYGVPLSSLCRRVEGKTEYAYVRAVEPSRLALEVLSEELPAILGKISFPKSMRWNSEVMFSRPVRWILALHGDVVVPLTFAGVLSGDVSHGLRNTVSATIKVESAESYMDVMQIAGITINIEQRKKMILEKFNSIVKSINGSVVVQSGLLDEVVNLVEAPHPVIGNFSKTFLNLPKDLLIMVMQKHQKYFAVTDQDGKLLPFFIAVANGAINEMVVRKGNEAVLRTLPPPHPQQPHPNCAPVAWAIIRVDKYICRARYEDAKFFYELDTSKRLLEFRNQLREILFHEKLGTMLDKMTRVQNLVTHVGLSLGITENVLQVIQDAASLAMADLSSAVVTEFTSLAGVMARHYALREGYSDQVANALFEITLPRFSGDILPKTDAGRVLAIADRLESLVGLFAAGCQPSSTNDPFGLRRISYGLVQLLVETNRNLELRHALELAAAVQAIKVEPQTIYDAHKFVTRRLEQLLLDKEISPEVVRAVLAERANWPCLAAKSAHKMQALSKGELLPKIIEAYSRPTRIVRGKDITNVSEVDEAAFETTEERALWSTFTSLRSKISPVMEVDDFVEASVRLVQPLEDFFNNVFVMVEDERIRKNRLALLLKISDLPKGIADLSILPGF
ncbi:Glycine--tRNA ligase, chloroplastic/mitochondrial 2 [Orobanche gracilis]